MRRSPGPLLAAFLVVALGATRAEGLPGPGGRGFEEATQIRIEMASIFVTDQDAARHFYTEVLGFTIKTDIPVGEYRFLTVASPAGAAGVELLLEPNAHPAAAAFQKAIYEDGIPATAFFVADIQSEFERLKGLGVVFRNPPQKTDQGRQAVFDDTCGNLIMLYER